MQMLQYMNIINTLIPITDYCLGLSDKLNAPWLFHLTLTIGDIAVILNRLTYIFLEHVWQHAMNHVKSEHESVGFEQ